MNDNPGKGLKMPGGRSFNSNSVPSTRMHNSKGLGMGTVQSPQRAIWLHSSGKDVVSSRTYLFDCKNTHKLYTGCCMYMYATRILISEDQIAIDIALMKNPHSEVKDHHWRIFSTNS